MEIDFTRVPISTREILQWADAKATDVGQPNIDNIHLLYACLIHPDIRNWLRNVHAPLEHAHLLSSLAMPHREESSPKIDADWQEVIVEVLQIFTAPREEKVTKLTDSVNMAFRFAGQEMSRFGAYYFHPIYLFAGVVQTDESLTERILLGREFSRRSRQRQSPTPLGVGE